MTHMFCRTPKTCTLRLAPRGLTLVEMLIGMAITLVMMAAVVTLFANIGAGVRVQRASMELGSQLRLARARLFKDLAGATTRPMIPKNEIREDGYLEIIEGQYSDKNPSLLTDGTDNGAASANPELDYVVSMVPSGGDPSIILPAVATPGAITNGHGLGDYDDILALTVRSESEPFVGRRTVLRPGGTATNPAHWIQETIMSKHAEVIWYAVENPATATTDEPGMRTIYRRVLLIAPWIEPIDLTLIATSGGTAILPGNANRFYQRNDISARFDLATNLWIPNSLSDLTKRENRFAHFFDPTIPTQGFPHAIRVDKLRVFPSTDTTPLHPFGPNWTDVDPGYDDPDRQGEDVMLNDVLAFDLRVFDPGAPLYLISNNITEPSDAGWATGGTKQGFGAFVDLGWLPGYAWNAATEPDARFYLRRQADSLVGYPCVYDTWSYHYESDGIDQDDLDGDNDGTTGADEGTDGLDSNTDANNVVDDAGERETAPPYDVPLRGMQVKLRVYDRDSRQIREATVTRNFVPQ